jgi:hypothetical protein
MGASDFIMDNFVIMRWLSPDANREDINNYADKVLDNKPTSISEQT